MLVAAVEHVLSPLAAQQFHLLLAANDVHQGYVIRQAQPVQHLPDIRGRGGMDEGRVSFAPHRLHHAQRGQRIDEGGSAVAGRHALGQDHAVGGPGDLISGERAWAGPQRHGTPDQGADILAGGHHRPGSFIAGRQRPPQPCRHDRHPPGGNLPLYHGLLRGPGLLQRFRIDRSKQQNLVGRIERRRLDSDKELIGFRSVNDRFLKPKAQTPLWVDRCSNFTIVHRAFLPRENSTRTLSIARSNINTIRCVSIYI